MNRYIRPVVYKSFQRCVIALTLVLLWDRFVNKGRMPWVVNGCFAAGAVFLALAWLAFLRLDGVRITPPRREERPRRWRSGDLVDFVDEHIVSFDEMDDEERIKCTLAAHLLCAVIFLAASAAAWIAAGG